MSVYVIVAAGGQGTRAGGAVPKQWARLGARTMLAQSVEACASAPDVAGLIVVVPADRVEGVETDLADATHGKPCQVVAGGARRQDSVANGAAALPDDASVVLVHDAARPFVSADVIARVVATARRDGAAIAAVPVHDTVKEVEPGVSPWCVGTLPRERIYLAQTPQGFRRDVFDEVVVGARLATEATDEATLAERAGYRVHVVPGDAGNVKITTADDLEAARRRHETPARGASMMTSTRIGTGYDSHRFDTSRPLKLGGVAVPDAPGLAGHSDGDALCHAVTDAILGALGLGDIGSMFPDTDAAWKDADSLDLLRQAARRVHDAGYQVGNLDAVVICQRPKIGPLAEALRNSLAGALDCAPDVISIKGKTPEGTPGLADALVVHVVALMTARS